MKSEHIVLSHFLSKTEIAVRMAVTTRTIDAWMSKGLIPYRKIGRTVRFDWEEVHGHLAVQQRSAQTQIGFSQARTGIADLVRTRAKEIRNQSGSPGSREPKGQFK